MKYISLKLLIFPIILFLFYSCEKVINIDLNKANPKIVIEAELSDQSFCKVKLTKTVNYDESNTFPPATGAIVKITDNLGNMETLTETTPGAYNGFTLQGFPGRTYTLQITSEENTYTSVSTIPAPVNIDTVLVEVIVGPHGNEKMIQAKYTDPQSISNFYRLNLFINGTEKEIIFIDDDRLQDGQLITYPFVPRDPSQGLSPNTGDTVTVYLQSIDQEVHEYFRTLNQMSGGTHGGSVSTANPKSNIDNGALGYFNAFSVRSKTIVVQ